MYDPFKILINNLTILGYEDYLLIWSCEGIMKKVPKHSDDWA